MSLIDRRALWAYAFAQASATYDPDDPDEITVLHPDGTLWFIIDLPDGAIRYRDAPVRVHVENRGFIVATPAPRPV